MASRSLRRIDVARRDQVQRRLHSGLRSDLDGSTIVVAESLGVADMAIAAGVTPRRIWVMTLPADLRFTPDDAILRRWTKLAPIIGGFLTDSELARAAIERATSGHRTRVGLFPPLAVDVPCPDCRDSNVAGDSDQIEPAVALLAHWRGSASLDYLPNPHALADLRLRGADRTDKGSGGQTWSDRSNAAAWFRPSDHADGQWTSRHQHESARAILDSAGVGGQSTRRIKRSVVVSGFDLKFARELAAGLDDRADLNVTLDEWRSLMSRSSKTAALTADADTIVAEWARPSAAWLAQRKQKSQLLIVRLHRYELDFPYPRQINIDCVDAVVCVSPPVGRRIEAELGWPAEKLVHIPNYMDFAWLRREKLLDARFGIGLVGIEWSNKRLDLALDILAAARRENPRYKLYVRSTAPWNNPYAWARQDERDYITWCLERIERDPDLRNGVVFDEPGQDMARWYRKVGHVLSMSDIESFHLAAAEGMASGAVPVIRSWPGASEIYGDEWIHASVDDAVAELVANADGGRWRDRASAAQARIAQIADPSRVISAWADLIHGDIAGARAHFATHQVD